MTDRLQAAREALADNDRRLVEHSRYNPVPTADMDHLLRMGNALREALALLQSGPDNTRVDEIVTSLYRRFREWNKRGFNEDDVTWCEVKAEIVSLMCLFPRDTLATQVEDCKEFIETVNGWFARHVAGEKQDNSAETMWDQAQARLARLDDPSQWVRSGPDTSRQSSRKTADALVDTFSAWLYDPKANPHAGNGGWEGLRRSIAAALDAAAEGQGWPDWQPPETAPLWSGHGIPPYVLVSNGLYVGVGYRETPSYPDDPEWVSEYGEFIEPPVNGWMPRPLPAPPVAASKPEGA